MQVSVLGGGSFGSSLAQVLYDNHHDVNIWAHNDDSLKCFLSEDNHYIDQDIKEQINATTNIDCISQSQLVVIVVPSFALRQTAQLMKPHLNDDTIIVLCTKGLERDSLKTGQVVLQEELGNINFCILSGPTHAEEVAKRMLTAIVATSEDEDIAKTVQMIFNNKTFRVYTNTDIKGVELAGAVKNILAIAAGFCDASPVFGDNTKALLLTRGLRELKVLTEFAGGSPQTVYGLTGVGDLMVTAFSKYSRNRQFGELVGKGMSVKEAQAEIGMVVEGYYSMLAVHQLTSKYDLDLPVIELIYYAVYHEVDINKLYDIVSMRSLKSEN